jgi:hypothetical protein
MSDEQSPPKWVTEEADRERGILTGADRELIHGYREFKHASTRSERRSDIRRRFVNGIEDLAYLSDLDDDSRQGIMDELETPVLYQAIAALAELVYVEQDGKVSFLEGAIERGVTQGESRRMKDTEYGAKAAEVEITPAKTYDLDSLEERIREAGLRAVSPDELGMLVRAGRLSPEDIEDLVDSDRDSKPFVGSLPDEV